MIPIDFQGKVALVTGVGDNESFAWSISKSLQAAGAKIVLGCHPRMVNIVRSLIDSDRPDDVEARILPHGAGQFTVEDVYACDVSFDSMADVPEEVKNDRRFNRHGDFTIQDMI